MNRYERKEHRKWAFSHSLADALQHELREGPPISRISRNEFEGISNRERVRLLKAIARYHRSTERNYNDAYNAILGGFFAGTRGIWKVLWRGAACGISAAGIVNTIAPNLFSTMLGYYAGTSGVKLLTKMGLVSVAIFSPPAFTHGAILAIGGIVGIVLYTLYALIRLICRACFPVKGRISAETEKEDR